MTDDNLPPGLSIRDIPGNRDIDEFYQYVMESVAEQFAEEAERAAEHEVWLPQMIAESYQLGYSPQYTASLIEEHIEGHRPKIDTEGL